VRSRSQASNGTRQWLLSFSIGSFEWHPANSVESRQHKSAATYTPPSPKPPLIRRSGRSRVESGTAVDQEDAHGFLFYPLMPPSICTPLQQGPHPERADETRHCASSSKHILIRVSWQPRADAFPQLAFVYHVGLIQHGGRHHVSNIAPPFERESLSDVLWHRSVDGPVSIKSPVSPWPGTSRTTYGKPAVSEARTRFYETFRKESVDSDKQRRFHDTEYSLILLVVRPLINAASFLRVRLIPAPRPLSARQTSPPLSNMTKTHRLRKSSPVRQDDVEAYTPPNLSKIPLRNRLFCPTRLLSFCSSHSSLAWLNMPQSDPL
jgi:hypothetical protein